MILNREKALPDAFCLCQSHDKHRPTRYGQRKRPVAGNEGLRMKKILLFWRVSILLGCICACTSVPSLRQGVQPDAVALNPARIAAFPTLTVPHPSTPASLDPASLMSGEIILSIETKILAAFRNQPGVNGIAFHTVRNSLKSNPGLLASIETEIRRMGQLVNSGAARETLLLTAECRARTNFLDFYKHCLLRSPNWVPLLNQFSLATQNADSVLIPLITSLEKTTSKGIYQLKFGLSLLLIDTNSGRLLWGRDMHSQIESPAGAKQFPDLKLAYDKIFTEDFWGEFPGRRSKTESAK